MTLKKAISLYGEPVKTDKVNKAVADSYRKASHKTGLTPAEIQAITWVTWRREKGLTD